MLQIDQLSFAYRSHSPVMQKISSELPSGCIAGLLGANGVGKSTLLKLIAGLLKPQAGSIKIAQHAPEKRSAALLEALYLVPEQTWVPDMRSDSYAKLYSPLYPQFNQSLFAQCLDRFELPYPKNLLDYSFGQQKKFLIAFGIATRPQLFILDEPTNGLDIPSKEQFRQLLMENCNEEQSIIISTHQAHDLQGMIDTAMFMDHQRLLTLNMENLATLFSVEKFENKPDKALYSTESLNKWLCLVPFLESSQRELDLELLFNAFHLNKDAFLRHITTSEQGKTMTALDGENHHAN